MARKLMILFTVLTVASSAFAESSFGLRAGLNLASIKGEDKSVPDYDNTIGFHVGAIVDIGISEFFYIQPGFFFSVKGAELYEKYGSESYETVFNPYYFEIPLLISAKIAIDESLALRINAGPYIGMTLTGTVEEKYENSEYPQDNYSDSGNTFKRMLFDVYDFGLVLGGGIEFQNFYLGMNYGIGLLNVVTYSVIEHYSRCLGITLGYNF
jgi:hypothetical protein